MGPAQDGQRGGSKLTLWAKGLLGYGPPCVERHLETEEGSIRGPGTLLTALQSFIHRPVGKIGPLWVVGWEELGEHCQGPSGLARSMVSGFTLNHKAKEPNRGAG